ncbi:MAG: hypothetical protein DRJ10_19010 [Bacteroidetes bacterium]|nr:MAG: hypothetical protein DRJ10_19010 [Bacteroidota bacterium]
MKQINPMNRIIIISILFLGVFKPAINAQTSEIKYKDVFKVVSLGNEAKSYEILLQYQKQDPFHANTYYHLGKITKKWAKNYDPLTDYENLAYFTYHAKLYCNLALKYLNEKNAKKDRYYYPDLKPLEGVKRVTHQQIYQELIESKQEVEDFEKTINNIRVNYYGAVRNYNKSLTGFKAIADKNSKLKDIYLTADEKLISEIKNIAISYDSTLYFFDIYKKAIADYPIMKYNQTYTLIPIETYRLEGLTKSNFLNNKISLWNYRQWSDTVLAVINNDIKELRIDIELEGKKIDSLTNILNLDLYTGNYDYYNLDEKLAYRIGRFDFQPLILDLFNYKASKLNLVIDSKKPINNPANINDSTMVFRNKLAFYKTLIEKKQQSDANLITLKNNITPFNILKYEDYLSTNINGKRGLSDCVDHEPENIKKILDASMQNLKKIIATEELSDILNRKKIAQKDGDIPLSILFSELSGEGYDSYYTSSKILDNNGDKYITGYYVQSDKNTQAFVAKCDSLLNLAWIQKIDYSPNKKNLINNFGTFINLTEKGCITTIHTRDTTGGKLLIQNWLVRLDADGKTVSKDSIGPNLVPRIMVFDDINQKVISVYKGAELNKFTSNMDTLIVEYADSSGQSIWQTPLVINGDIVNVLRSNDKVILAANYTELFYNGELKKPQNSKAGAMLAIFNNEGSIINIKTYSESYPFYMTHAVKLDSETINLVGVKTDSKDLFDVINNSKIQVYYNLIDTKGEINYKY